MQTNEEMREEAARLGEMLKIRRDKLGELKAQGNNPYDVVSYDKTHSSEQVISDFEHLEGKDVSIAGRLIAKRVMGKASFAHVLDEKGRIQIYVRREDLGEDAYNEFKKYDIGDIVGVKGKVFKTKTGEVSIHAGQCVLMTKSLLPLPEKFHGLKDMELRYRQRYVDLMVNPEVREAFRIRSAIISMIRKTLDAKGFLEVETPVLHNHPTNAAAKPFQTHHNTLDIGMYLRVELELYLKRLIVGGFERVYEIGRVFRNEGMSYKHNPEFTVIELYQAYTDYHGMMAICEELFSQAAQMIKGTLTVEYEGQSIDLTPSWRRLTMIDSIKEYAGVDFNAIQDDEQARQAAKTAGLTMEGELSRGEIINLFFEEFVEAKLIQPTFICDYPVEISPLAKRTKYDPRLVERFELFMCGREMGNAFTELNDPIDQRERFVEQAMKKNTEGEFEIDEDFITAMEYGMPPTGGLGIGIDRMVMLFTNASSIRDILLFPTMRNK